VEALTKAKNMWYLKARAHPNEMADLQLCISEKYGNARQKIKEAHIFLSHTGMYIDNVLQSKV